VHIRRTDVPASAGPRRARALWALLLLLSSGSIIAAGADAADTDATFVVRHDRTRIQGIVDDFRTRLTVPNSVRVTLVQKNALMVSVETLDGSGGEFLLSIEDGFIDELSEDELKAAIAHELGHVWIFTHHPYLQTEALANQIAERLVPRENLARVYEKVWRILGTKGDLARFLGD
jgi:hypothetical protein